MPARKCSQRSRNSTPALESSDIDGLRKWEVERVPGPRYLGQPRYVYRVSVVERHRGDLGVSRVIIRHGHPPGPAADLAVLLVLLHVAAPCIEGDLVGLAAVGADD